MSDIQHTELLWMLFRYETVDGESELQIRTVEPQGPPGSKAGEAGTYIASLNPGEEARFNQNGLFIVRACNSHDDLLAACEIFAKVQHHSACPIATGKGQTTVTHDDCTCHVRFSRDAITKAKGRAEAMS